MPRPPETKKPIPRSLEKWEREVAGIRRFLNTMNRLRWDNGDVWVRKQRTYYRLRLRDLMDNAPPGALERDQPTKAGYK